MAGYRNIKIRWLLGCLIFFGCRANDPVQRLSEAEKTSILEEAKSRKQFLQSNLKTLLSRCGTGDLVVRQGNDFTSQNLRQLNQRDKTYSHIGIISVEADSVFVFHIMGGEWNPDAKIMKQRFEDFVSTTENNLFALYRLDLLDVAKKQIVQNAIAFQKTGISFDMKFDLVSREKMYCAEFVYHCVQPVVTQHRIPFSRIENFTFVGVDDIILLPECVGTTYCNYITHTLENSAENTSQHLP